MGNYDILHLAHSYLPDNLGMSRRMSSLLTNVTYTNHFIVSDRRFSGAKIAFKDEQDRNNRITRINTDVPGPVKRCQLELAYQLLFIRQRLVQFAVTEQYKIIHGHQGPEFATAACSIANALDLPLIYEEHVPLADYNHNFVRPILERVRRYILHRADAIITQTENAKKKILANYAFDSDKIHVITNGVDSHYFDPAVHSGAGLQLKQSIGASQDRLITYIGHLDGEYNGVDLIIKLAHDQEILAHNLKFLFVGEGPLKAQIIEIAKTNSRVIYMPSVPPAQVGPLYSMSDIFLLPRPSRLATEILYPLKLLEAMAMEKLVIVSNLTCLREVVDHGQNGLIFGRESKLTLKACVLEALQSNMRPLQRKARESILARFDWRESSTELNALYTRLLN
ncbi:MAG: glycosyltransferase family 4 protein [Caldilineaceae bacterium]